MFELAKPSKYVNKYYATPPCVIIILVLNKNKLLNWTWFGGGTVAPPCTAARTSRAKTCAHNLSQVGGCGSKSSSSVVYFLLTSSIWMTWSVSIFMARSSLKSKLLQHNKTQVVVSSAPLASFKQEEQQQVTYARKAYCLVASALRLIIRLNALLIRFHSQSRSSHQWWDDQHLSNPLRNGVDYVHKRILALGKINKQFP